VILTVHNSQDPALAPQGGIGFSNLESFRGSNTVYYADFTANSASDQQFTINLATGELKALNGPGNSAGESCYYTAAAAASYINISPSDFATNEGGQLCLCQVLSASGQLQCQFGNQIAEFWTCDYRLNLVQPGFDFTNECADADTSYKVNIYAQVIGYS
jgi:hypothetical protein